MIFRPVQPPFTFFIPGKPVPGGSKRVFKKKRGPGFNVVDDAKGNKGWRKHVNELAWLAMHGKQIINGPVEMKFVFHMPRPKNHFTPFGLRDHAPSSMTVKPDALKLTRAVEDALTGIVYVDDAMIVKETIEKHWVAPGCQTGVEITVIERAS